MKKKYWDQNTLLEDLYKRSPKLSLLMTPGRMFLEFFLLEKNVTTFLPFSFLWLSQLNIRRFFPNKYWCKCWFQGQTTFVKSLFLRHFTICWDCGSTVLVWIVTGLLWSNPSGTVYWDLKLISRCRLSSIWWLCRGIRWKSMTTTVLTSSRGMSFSSKFLTNRGLQIRKDNIVTILLFFLPS